MMRSLKRPGEGWCEKSPHRPPTRCCWCGRNLVSTGTLFVCPHCDGRCVDPGCDCKGDGDDSSR